VAETFWQTIVAALMPAGPQVQVWFSPSIRSQTIGNTVNGLVVVSIRHQEEDSVLTDEMQEAMSLFGRHATADKKHGNQGQFGAAYVARVMRFARQRLGVDYMSQLLRMVVGIQHFVRNEFQGDVPLLFTGFSLGGFFAQALALYHQKPAIVFSACGIEDLFVESYPNLLPHFTTHSEAHRHRLFNFFALHDQTPMLDCQIGYVCAFSNQSITTAPHLMNQTLAEAIHLASIFGTSGEPNPTLLNNNTYTCVPGETYSRLYGTCAREQKRWKERIEELKQGNEHIPLLEHHRFDHQPDP